MIVQFVIVLGIMAVLFALAAGVAWVGQTAWAWLERSDAERGLSFRLWLRSRADG